MSIATPLYVKAKEASFHNSMHVQSKAKSKANHPFVIQSKKRTASNTAT
jgi:hypothetical protein